MSLRRGLSARRLREARLRRRPRLESLEARQLMATLSMAARVEFLEDHPVQLAQGVEISDADGAGFSGCSLTVAVTGNQAAEDQLQVVGSGSLTTAGSDLQYNGQTFASFSGGAGQPLVIDFGDSVTPAAGGALLSHLYFNTQTDAPVTADRIVTLSLRGDDGALFDQDAVAVSVLAVNDRPTVGGLNIEQRFTIGQGRIAVAPQGTVADPDSGFAGGSLTARVAANINSDDRLVLATAGELTLRDDVLSYHSVPVGTISSSRWALTVTFNSAADQPAVQAVLRAVAFNNGSQSPGPGIRRIELSLTDSSGASSDVQSVFVPVRSPVPLPTISGLGSAEYQEHGSVLLAPAAVLSDSGNQWAIGGSLSITITAGREASDSIYLQNAGAEVDQIGSGRTSLTYRGVEVARRLGGFGDEPLRIVFNQNATTEAVQAILRCVTFASASSRPGTQPREIEVRLDSGYDATFATAAVSLEISAVNTAPFVATTDVWASFVEGDQPVLIGAKHTIIDFDSDDFDGGSLVVAIATNRGVTDSLAIVNQGSEPGQIGIDGDNVTYGGTAIGTFSIAEDGATLNVNLSSAANPASVTALVRNVTFFAGGSELVTAERTITISLSDGDGAVSEARKTSVFVMGVNDLNTTYNVWPIQHDANVTSGWLRPAPEVVLPDLSAYAGGYLKVDTTTEHYNGDQFWILHQGNGPGQIGFNKDTKAVTYSGYQIGRMRNTSLNPLNIQLDSRVSNEAMQALVRQVGIRGHEKDVFRTAQIRFTHYTQPDFKLPDIPIVYERFDYFPVLGFAAPFYTEGAAPGIVSPTAWFDDYYAPNLAGGMVSFVVTGAGPRYDYMTLAHQGDAAGEIGIGAGEVRYGGTIIAQFGGGFAGEPLRILFNEQSTSAAAQALLQRVTYQSIGQLVGGPQRLSVTANDGQGEAPTIHTPVDREIGLYANDDPAALLELDAVGVSKAQPTPIAPAAVLVDVDTPDYRDQGLRVSISNTSAAYVRLGLLDQGDGPGQFRLRDGKLFYEGQLVGRDESQPGQVAGSDTFHVIFEQSIAREAVQRLLRSVAVVESDVPTPSSLVCQVVVQFDASPDKGDGFAVTIHSENVPPSLEVGGNIQIAENAGPAVLAASAAVQEVDSENFYQGRLQVSLVGHPHADSQLAIRHQGLAAGQIGIAGNHVLFGGTLIGVFSGGLGGQPLVISLTAAATAGKVEALVRNVAFTNASDDPPAAQHVEFLLTDRYGGVSDASVVTVSIEPVNDAPTLVAGGHQFAPAPGEGLPAPDADLYDPDSSDFGGGSLRVWMDGAAAQDYLRPEGLPQLQSWQRRNVYVDGTLIGAYSGGLGRATLAVTFNGNATQSLVEKLLRGITFGTTNPYAGTHAVHHVLRDGDGGVSNTANVIMFVLGDNAAPVLDNSLSPVLRSIPEDVSTPASTLVSTLLRGAVTDANAGDRRGIAVSGASDFFGTWEFTLDNGTTWQAMGGPSGDAARLLPETARVRFLPKADFHGDVKLSYRAWDQTAGFAGGTLDVAVNKGGQKTLSTAYDSATLTVTPVNDAPQLSFSESIGYIHDKPAITLAAFAAVSDIDSLNFAYGDLRVRIGDGASSSNRLAIGSGFTVDANNNVLQGTTIIGRRLANGFGTNELVIRFNSNATPSVAQQLLRAITFRTVGGSAARRTVLFTLSDGDGGTSAEAVKLVNVT